MHSGHLTVYIKEYCLNLH